MPKADQSEEDRRKGRKEGGDKMRPHERDLSTRCRYHDNSSHASGQAAFAYSVAAHASCSRSSRTCLTRALPGENFLLEMAGLPMPILRVSGITVDGSVCKPGGHTRTTGRHGVTYQFKLHRLPHKCYGRAAWEKPRLTFKMAFGPTLQRGGDSPYGGLKPRGGEGGERGGGVRDTLMGEVSGEASVEKGDCLRRMDSSSNGGTERGGGLRLRILSGGGVREGGRQGEALGDDELISFITSTSKVGSCSPSPSLAPS